MPGPDFEVEPEHLPMRGDAVERWLKAKRDEIGDGRHRDAQLNYGWHLLDKLLDDYRLRADTGLTLADDLSETGEYGTDYATMVRDLDDRIARLRGEFHERARLARRDPSFRDERLGRRRAVVDVPLPCRCVHDLVTGECSDHGYRLMDDNSCWCPKSL